MNNSFEYKVLLVEINKYVMSLNEGQQTFHSPICLYNPSNLQLDHCSHSNSAGHYYGINTAEILNSGRIGSLVFSQRVNHNIFVFCRPQNV